MYGATDQDTAQLPTPILPPCPASTTAVGCFDWVLSLSWHTRLPFHCPSPLDRLPLECRHDFIGHGARRNTRFKRRQDLRFLLCAFLWCRLYHRVGYTDLADVSPSASPFSHRRERY